MWEMTDFLRVFCSTEHLSLHVILAIKGWFCSERCQSGLEVKNRVWQPSYLQINKLPIFPFLSIRCDRNQSRDIQPARQLANLASWEQRMLISFGSCENPSRPGNYDTSEICRSIAWSNTMIFRLIMPDYYHFFFSSSSHCHCGPLNRYFGWLFWQARFEFIIHRQVSQLGRCQALEVIPAVSPAAL